MIKNVLLYIEDVEMIWFLKVFILEIEIKEVIEDNWKIFFDEFFDELFVYYIEWIWLLLCKVIKILKLMLWENVVVYIYWFYDLFLVNEEIENV